MKTRAAVLQSVGAPLVIEELELQPPRANEVLVRVHAAGVCRSDLQVMTGTTPHVLPAVLGHEGAGVVVKCGSESANLRPGDRVIFNWAPACGQCFYCDLRRPALCSVTKDAIWAGVMQDGTPRMYLGRNPVYQYCALGCFSEYVVVAEAACVPLPTNFKIPMPIAALIGCCVTTGVGVVLNTARVPTGSDVVVYGAGGVGLSAILGARLVGAGLVLAVDPVPDRLIKAAEFGADGTLAGNDGDASIVRERTESRGADYVIEATGIPSVQEACLEAVRPGGTLVLAGLAPVGSNTNFPAARITRREITITGSYYGTSVPKDDFLQYARYYLEGQLPLDRMITRQYPLEEVMQAYEDLEQGRLIRGVLLMDG